MPCLMFSLIISNEVCRVRSSLPELDAAVTKSSERGIPAEDGVRVVVVRQGTKGFFSLQGFGFALQLAWRFGWRPNKQGYVM